MAQNPAGESRPEYLKRPDLGRQLTVGEVLCARRIAETFANAGAVLSEERLWSFVDVLNVCTTCGWGAYLHTAPRSTRKDYGCCAQFSPAYAQEDSAL